jgi:hypothetical protein
VPERSIGAVSKTVDLRKEVRGFESHPLRQEVHAFKGGFVYEEIPARRVVARRRAVGAEPSFSGGERQGAGWHLQPHGRQQDLRQDRPPHREIAGSLAATAVINFELRSSGRHG